MMKIKDNHLQLESMQHGACINQVGKDEKAMVSSIRKSELGLLQVYKRWKSNPVPYEILYL